MRLFTVASVVLSVSAALPASADMQSAVPSRTETVKRIECPISGFDLWCEEERDEVWTATPDAPEANSMVVSPKSDRVFTAGPFGIVAHDVHSGEELWSVELEGIPQQGGAPAGSVEVLDVEVSPDGQRVFAIGVDTAPEAVDPNDQDAVVAAYDASTGARVWHVTIGLFPEGIEENDRVYSREGLQSVAVSPDGLRVYVTGWTFLIDRFLGPITKSKALTVAFDTGTGAERWVATTGSRYIDDVGMFIEVSPDSRTVYVGGLLGPAVAGVYLTLALRAFSPQAPGEEGEVLWQSGYAGMGGGSIPSSMVLAPDGASMYLTGRSRGESGETEDWDYATVAFDTITGAAEWGSRYEGPSDQLLDEFGGGFSVSRRTHVGVSLTVSPAGDKVFVTGRSPGRDLYEDDLAEGVIVRGGFGTIAYDATTGEELWTAHATMPTPGEGVVVHGGGDGDSVHVSPDGKRIYVAWEGGQTAAYDTGTGSRIWVAADAGRFVEATRDGKLVIAATSQGSIRAYDARP